MGRADERGSARLAAAVVERVVASHPTVGVEAIAERPTQHFTVVSSTTSNKRGALVTLYANFDWSFTLECGRLRVFNDELMTSDDEVGRVDLIVREIEAIAKHGLRRSRFDWFLTLGVDRLSSWTDKRYPYERQSPLSGA